MAAGDFLELTSNDPPPDAGRLMVLRKAEVTSISPAGYSGTACRIELRTGRIVHSVEGFEAVKAMLYEVTP